MPDLEIRVCAREDCENTFEYNPKGYGARRKYCDEHKAVRWGDKPKVVEPDEVIDPIEANGHSAEQRPTAPDDKPEPLKGLKRWWGKGKEEAKPPAPTGERRPAAPKRRVSTADFWGGCVGPVASLVARGGYVPTARAMIITQPIVGDVIEDATKGTIIDAAVQPICRNAEKWQNVGDMLGLWIAVTVASQNPMFAMQAREFGKARLANLLPRIAANMKKEAARQREAVQAMADVMPDLMMMFPDGIGDDPLGSLVDSFFAVPEQEMEGAGVP